MVSVAEIESLDHNPARGITYYEAANENLEIFSVAFNPKHRLLVAGGSLH